MLGENYNHWLCTFFEGLTLLGYLLVQFIISHAVNVLNAVFIVHGDVGAIWDQLFNLGEKNG